VQVLELANEMFEQHEPRPQPKNRERVRAVDDESTRTDRERRWHGVDREYDIRHLHRDQRDE
jgi:hypothetical protein